MPTQPTSQIYLWILSSRLHPTPCIAYVHYLAIKYNTFDARHVWHSRKVCSPQHPYQLLSQLPIQHTEFVKPNLPAFWFHRPVITTIHSTLINSYLNCLFSTENLLNLTFLLFGFTDQLSLQYQVGQHGNHDSMRPSTW